MYTHFLFNVLPRVNLNSANSYKIYHCLVEKKLLFVFLLWLTLTPRKDERKPVRDAGFACEVLCLESFWLKMLSWHTLYCAVEDKML